MSSSLPSEQIWVPILYGSQTGTAQDAAEYISRKLGAMGFRVWLGSLDSFPLEALPLVERVVLVVATTGDGEPPQNMRGTWDFLRRKSLRSDSLCNLKFSMFALGDSTYEKFCAAGRRLSKRLEQLGAEAMTPFSFGDEQGDGGIFKALDSWFESLTAEFKRQKLLQLSSNATNKYSPKEVAFKISDGESCLDSMCEYYQGLVGSEYISKGIRYGHLLEAELADKRRLTDAEHFQNVLHIELRVEGARYDAGDVVLIHPENDPEKVKEFARFMGFDLERQIAIAPSISAANEVLSNDPIIDSIFLSRETKFSDHFPKSCSVKQLLTRCLDILGVPRRSFFEKLIPFAKNLEEREKLIELSEPQGADLLHEYCAREKRTYLEVLRDFPSCKMSLERILELVPKLQPRSFSIASCHQNGQIDVCVAVVKYKTRLKRTKTGVCSSWLEKINENERVYLSIQKGSFKVPEVSSPVIMIGPGTGIAPMRSIIQKRSIQDGTNKINNVLFFGCRFESKDYLYKSELEELKMKGKISLFTAFSREEIGEGGGKVYVQHLIRKQGKAISKLLLEQDTHIFVSGRANQMPSDVRKALCEVLANSGKMDLKDASAFLKKMESKGRYQIEAWS
mmetsp:Transcript_18882/g.26614  ORF Transcript_18882/g.26614 Transcript_18882/m.26614 type:complete len:622 (+) Transcript_18882:33-1898(+)